MLTTNLRKVGGSIMLTVPPALLNLLDLQAGDTVGIGVDNGRLVIEPVPRPHYTLADLLAQCDASQEVSREDLEWLNAKPVGNELL